MTVPVPDFVGGSLQADHLCVLVHGLWGNPMHLRNVAKSLREHHSRDELYLLLAKENSGSFTYDGVELGGERVCAEIEEEIRDIENRGGKIKKLSIVGYSLGGIVSRYAVGLLYARGILDNIECMNFTTFVSPHLGALMPLKGLGSQIWNDLAARSFSMSGRQLFMIDNFRDTGRPLFSILADTNSIFMSGLHMFKRHTVYSNIANDQSTLYYTTSIRKTDPFADLGRVKFNFLKGYEGVILDPKHPVAPRPKIQLAGLMYDDTIRWMNTMFFIILYFLILPIITFHALRSSYRIKLYETNRAGLTKKYRMPVWINQMREGVEQAYGNINNSQKQEYLAVGDSESDSGMDTDDLKVLRRERRRSTPAQPTLALKPFQFEMIDNLNTLSWRRYPVWIQSDSNSHGAVIVRDDKKSFSDGYVVLRHFAVDEFLR